MDYFYDGWMHFFGLQNLRLYWKSQDIFYITLNVCLAKRRKRDICNGRKRGGFKLRF